MRDLVIYGSKAEEITIRRLLIKFLSEISERRHVRKIQRRAVSGWFSSFRLTKSKFDKGFRLLLRCVSTHLRNVVRSWRSVAESEVYRRAKVALCLKKSTGSYCNVVSLSICIREIRFYPLRFEFCSLRSLLHVLVEWRKATVDYSRNKDPNALLHTKMRFIRRILAKNIICTVVVAWHALCKCSGCNEKGIVTALKSHRDWRRKFHCLHRIRTAAAVQRNHARSALLVTRAAQRRELFRRLGAWVELVSSRSALLRRNQVKNTIRSLSGATPPFLAYSQHRSDPADLPGSALVPRLAALAAALGRWRTIARDAGQTTRHALSDLLRVMQGRARALPSALRRDLRSECIGGWRSLTSAPSAIAAHRRFEAAAAARAGGVGRPAYNMGTGRGSKKKEILVVIALVNKIVSFWDIHMKYLRD